MESKSKNLIINFIFTLLVIGISLPLILESRIYFNRNSNKTFLSSDFVNYKVSSVEVKKNVAFLTQTKDFLLIQNKAVKNIEVVKDLYELERVSLPSDVMEEISKNPLLSGFYVQLGIFKTKDEAQKIIEYLVEKGTITEDYNTYIETKIMQGRSFYIPQIGVFNIKNDAIYFCSGLQKMQINCLIVD